MAEPQLNADLMSLHCFPSPEPLLPSKSLADLYVQGDWPWVYLLCALHSFAIYTDISIALYSLIHHSERDVNFILKAIARKWARGTWTFAAEVYSNGNKLHSSNTTAGHLALSGLKQCVFLVLHHLAPSSSFIPNFIWLWQQGKGLALTTHILCNCSDADRDFITLALKGLSFASHLMIPINTSLTAGQWKHSWELSPAELKVQTTRGWLQW